MIIDEMLLQPATNSNLVEIEVSFQQRMLWRVSLSHVMFLTHDTFIFYLCWHLLQEGILQLLFGAMLGAEHLEATAEASAIRPPPNVQSLARSSLASLDHLNRLRYLDLIRYNKRICHSGHFLQTENGRTWQTFIAKGRHCKRRLWAQRHSSVYPPGRRSRVWHCFNRRVQLSRVLPLPQQQLLPSHHHCSPCRALPAPAPRRSHSSPAICRRFRLQGGLQVPLFGHQEDWI